MTKQASTIDERGEPFLMFTRRGTKEMPVQLCWQETEDSPLQIKNLSADKALSLAVQMLNHAVMGK